MRWIGLRVFTVLSTFVLVVPSLVAARLLGADPGLMVLVVLAFWILWTLLHELGHAGAAWLLGWDVHAITVCGVSFLPARGGFGNVPGQGRSRLGGYVIASPRTAEAWSSRDYPLFAFGGPFANFVVAALAFLAVALSNPAGPVPPAVPVLIGAFGLSSLVFGIINLVPLRWESGRRSDGARLIDYLRGRERPLLAYARTRMSGLMIDRVPPRRWDPALPERILRDDRDANWLMVAALSFFSAGHLSRALEAMRAAQAARPGADIIEPSAMAYLLAMVEHDLPAARQWLAKCGSEDRYDFGCWRARMVILALEGRRDDARAAAAQARLAAVNPEPDEDDEALLAAIEHGRDPPLRTA